MVRAMVHSTKHYVQTTLANIVAPAVSSLVIVDAVATLAKNLPSEVEEGSSVKAVYFEHWLKAGEASNSGFFELAIYKNPGSGTTFSAGQMTAMHTSENKKNVFYFSQGLININSGSATNVIKGWIKIPKSKQRMGLGDRIVLTINAPAINIDHCGFATYKEYS